MSATIVGKWELSTSENFDEFMKAIGVNLLLRKAGASLSSTSEITEEGDGKIRINTTSTFKSANVLFILGEEIEEKTMDGRQCKSVMTRDGDKKLNQVQTWNDGKKKSVLQWIMEEDDKMVLVLEHAGITAKRIHKRI